MVICHKCGTILHEGEELKSPFEIVESYDGNCPNCREKLSDIAKKFEVKPIDIAKELSPLEPEKKRSSSKKSRK